MNLAEALLSPQLLENSGELPAFTGPGGTMTYAELARLVEGCAHVFAELGVGRGALVPLSMKDCPLLVAAHLGAMRMGAVPTFISPRMPAADVAAVIAGSRPALVVNDETAAQAVAGLDCRLLAADELAARAAAAPGPFPAVALGPEDEAFRVYSSGTTGKPKGIVHGHKAPWPFAAYGKDFLGLKTGEKIFCTSRLSFAYALGNGYLGPLQLGAAIVLEPDWPTPESALATIARERPAVVYSTPTLYRGMLAAMTDETRAAAAAVRHYVSAGEGLPEPLAAEWKDAVGVDILNAYGCSETVALAIAMPPADIRPGLTGVSVSGGEFRLALFEGERDEPGALGQLWMRHPFLALGYFGNPEQTAARFVDGWYDTGDVFSREADGYWTHRGRQDGLIKVAGQWVQLREIEDIATASGGAAEVAAVVAKDGRGFGRVGLFVVPEERLGEQAAVRRVQQAFEAVPKHKWPKWVRAIDALPRTSTGKIQTYRLREMIEREDA